MEFDNNFRKYDGSRVEATDYVLNFLKDYPGAKIVVGCDSQHVGSDLQYAVIIAMFYPMNKGAHLIYRKYKKILHKNNISLYERLWEEIEVARLTAQTLEEAIYNSGYLFDIDYNEYTNYVQVHIDINNDAKYKSNVLLNSAFGYLTGLGFEVSCKPESWVASCAADVHVK